MMRWERREGDGKDGEGRERGNKHTWCKTCGAAHGDSIMCVIASYLIILSTFVHF